MRKKAVCKICRRLGQKLFLKGEKCLSPKCVLMKKPYPPGQKPKKVRPSTSEYKKELVEKQKLRHWYNLSERQFRNYVKKILAKRGKLEDASLELIKLLEKRLDNVVYRLGFASSQRQARQLVAHGYFLVNNKPVNIPSYIVKVGDTISLKPAKKKKNFFKERKIILKQLTPASWLKLDPEKAEGKIIREPTFEEAGVPVEISAVFEFYSR